MRSYEFPYPETEQQTVVSRFGGIDCRTHPTKVSLSRSPDTETASQAVFLLLLRTAR